MGSERNIVSSFKKLPKYLYLFFCKHEGRQLGNKVGRLCPGSWKAEMIDSVGFPLKKQSSVSSQSYTVAKAATGIFWVH